MAAVTPVAKGTAGWVAPGRIYANAAAASPNTLTGGRVIRTEGLIHERWYFADVDNAELWTAVPAGTVAIATHVLPDQGSSATAFTMNANRQALASSGLSNCEAIVHTWRRGSKWRASGTNVPPVSKGTSGYLTPARTLLAPDHDDGATDPLVTGRFKPTANGHLRHIVLYFTGVDASANDTWTPNARLMPKIVDYAWQGIEAAADRAQPVLGTTAVTFFGDASTEGWLHLWVH